MTNTKKSKTFLEDANLGEICDSITINLTDEDFVEMKSTISRGSGAYLRFNKKQIKEMIKYLQRIVK